MASWLLSSSYVTELWRELLKELLSSYRLQLHSMRARGQRWREKRGAALQYDSGAQISVQGFSRNHRTSTPDIPAAPRPGVHAAGRPPRLAALSSRLEAIAERAAIPITRSAFGTRRSPRGQGVWGGQECGK